MPINNSEQARLPDELKIEVLTGAYDLIGTLEFNPVLIIFDNQSLVSVEIGTTGSTTWRTFPAGEALVLDLRDKAHNASNFTFRKGMPFYAKGSAGANTFSISYVYAREN